MELFSKFVENNKKIRVAVVGDCVIDQYYSVSVERISPEFPIPVVKAEDSSPTSVKPGGAANVAYQMRHANVDVDLFCFADEEAISTLSEFDNFKVHSACLKDSAIPRKKRFYDGHFPVFRYDVEVPDCGSDELRDELYEKFKKEVKLNRPDVVILSDYNKGVFNYNGPYFARRIICHCRDKGIPVIVDPKTGPIEQWKGCTVFKPNSKEAKDFSGLDCWQEQLTFLHNALIDGTRDHQVIVTRGEDGVSGYNEKNFTKEPFWTYRSGAYNQLPSVIGAGDCFVAYLAMAFAKGHDVYESSQIADRAGGIYVRERRNHPVRPSQLLRGREAKVVTPDDLKGRGFTLACTNGCWDLIHVGYLKTFKFAKTKADKLVVLVNSDASVKRLKGESRPINCLEDRMEVLASIEDVDYIIPFEEDSPYDLIKEISPDCLIKGGDYTKDQIRSSELVKETFIVPLVEGVSTTEMIKRTFKSLEEIDKKD